MHCLVNSQTASIRSAIDVPIQSSSGGASPPRKILVVTTRSCLSPIDTVLSLPGVSSSDQRGFGHFRHSGRYGCLAQNARRPDWRCGRNNNHPPVVGDKTRTTKHSPKSISQDPAPKGNPCSGPVKLGDRLTRPASVKESTTSCGTSEPIAKVS